MCEESQDLQSPAASRQSPVCRPLLRTARAADGSRTLICAASVTAQLRYDVHVDDFKPEVGDPSHEPAEGSLIWQLGAKGCRAGAGTDLAVVEFRAQRRTRLARESDLICL